MNTASSSGLGSVPSNTVANSRGKDLKAITTRSGISYDGPPIPPLPKVVERERLTKVQVWQTATANTKAGGSLEINATIDTIGYTITEASIRDSLR
ncbi:hypothetical protein Tco_0398983, partial [Tanacetum coccineum]